jgi:hypothetical protein
MGYRHPQLPSTSLGNGVESIGPDTLRGKAFGLHILPTYFILPVFFRFFAIKEFRYETSTQARLRPHSVSRQSGRGQNHIKTPGWPRRLLSG